MGVPVDPDLTIIIVNRNTRDLLSACLDSIDRATSQISCEVIVVDNASTDGSVEMLRERRAGVRLITNDVNTGFARPNNQGLELARGRYVLLLNSDTEVGPDSLVCLVRYLDEHPAVGACGPRLLYPDRRLQRSCFSFPTPWRHFADMMGLGRFFPRSRLLANQREWFSHQVSGEVDWVMGAAIAVRATAVQQIGLLDERFSLYSNEVDWCFRLRAAGWKVHFVRDAEVVHHCGATRRSEDAGLSLQPELLRNQFDYFLKHYGRSGLWWFRLWLVIGYGVRAARAGMLGRLRRSPAEVERARRIRAIARIAALPGGRWYG